MCFQVSGVDHDDIWLSCASSQTAENTIKHTHSRPTDKAIVEGLVRPIDFRRIPPPQTVSDDVDYPADYTPVIDTGSTMGARKIRLNNFKLSFA
jgi:hypothetical protein